MTDLLKSGGTTPAARPRRPAGPLKRIAGFLLSIALTFLGLLLVTFLIGRVVPIDPVLAAVVERDAEKRVEIYHELQKTVMNESPFVVMFQQVEVPVERADVKGLIWGPSFDNNLYRLASKK